MIRWRPQAGARKAHSFQNFRRNCVYFYALMTYDKGVKVRWRMNKIDILDRLLKENSGYLRTADAVGAGVSRAYFGEYVQRRELERVAHGVYMAQDAWDDGMYVLQVRYPMAVFSHETASYLLGLAEREPSRYSVTFKAGASSAGLAHQGIKVYKVMDALFELGLSEAKSPARHLLRVYNLERTICDLVRSRSQIEFQELQYALKTYVRRRDKNLPLLMRYAESFSVTSQVRQYLEMLL